MIKSIFKFCGGILTMLMSVIIYFIALIGYLTTVTIVGLFWLIFEVYDTLVKVFKIEKAIKFIDKQRITKLKKAQEGYDE